jgi:heat shock protein HspQ
MQLTTTVAIPRQIRFTVGELVRHEVFHYRGAVVDVDPFYMGTEDWYDHVYLDRPARDRPWYLILVDHLDCLSYVPEGNLNRDQDGDPICNRLIDCYFSGFGYGRYQIRQIH